MPKVSDLVSNLFSRSKSKLETDAVGIPQDVQEIESPTSILPSDTTVPHSLALSIQRPAETMPMNQSPSSVGSTNNHVLVNSTSGHNVFQITNCTGMQFGNTYHFTTPDSSTKKNMPRTRTVDTMLKSTEPLSPKAIDVISTHLGEGWQSVMRALDYSDGEIHQYKVNYLHDGGLREVIYKLLLDWHNDQLPTLGSITEVLWRSGHRETVYKLKEWWKAQQVTGTNASEKENLDENIDTLKSQ